MKRCSNLFLSLLFSPSLLPFPSPLLMSLFFTSLHFPLPSPLLSLSSILHLTSFFSLLPTPLSPQHIFTLEKQEYQREGINMAEVKFQDNKPLLVCKAFTHFRDIC